MFDPLGTTPAGSPFASSSSQAPPWPTTPHSPQLEPPLSRRAPPAGHFDPNPRGREPQIYGQEEPGLISPANNKLSNGSKLEKVEPYLRIRLTALDRNRRDILIRFDAQTNLPNFNGTAYRNVSRSYVEFQRFAEQIVYSNPQTIIPALPLPQTSAPTDEEDDRLVKLMLQRWLTRICEDPVVIHDDEMRSFVECDFGYQPTIRPKRKTGSSFNILRRSGAPDEDEELLAARYELTRLETQFFDAAKAIDKLSRARKALAAAHAEMGNRMISVATTETDPGLGNAMRKLGRAWHSIGDNDHAHAVSESVILGDSLGYQGMNSKSAKETLMQRAQALEEAQAAAKVTINKRRQIERLKASSNLRPEKVDEALEELEEAQQIENVLARRVNGISQNLHKAIITHSRHAHDDVTSSLIEHVRASLVYEKTTRREIEAVRVDVRNIGRPQPTRAVLPPQVPPITGLAPSARLFPTASYNGNPQSASSAQTTFVPSSLARGPPSSGPLSVAPQKPLIQGFSKTSPSMPNSPAPVHAPIPQHFLGAASVSSPVRNATAPSSSSSTPAPALDPLSQSAVVAGRPPLDPLMAGSQTLGRSFVQQPARNRIDQREAARKLANFL